MSILRVLSLGLLFSLTIHTSCEQKYNQGKVMYDFHCAGCHLEDGTGLGEIYPPLTNNDYVLNNIREFACIIAQGMNGKINVDGKNYNGEMPSNRYLSAVEITNIINYMNYTFDYGISPLQLSETLKDLERCDWQPLN